MTAYETFLMEYPVIRSVYPVMPKGPVFRDPQGDNPQTYDGILPEYSFPKGYTLTQDEADHEAGHGFFYVMQRHYPERDLMQEFWSGLLGRSGSWKDALAEMEKIPNDKEHANERWQKDPRESWAETFANSISPHHNKTLLGNDSLTTEQCRAWFQSLMPTTAQPKEDPLVPIQGVDISKWQGAVDFGQLATACRFVLIKTTEGVGYTDPLFADRWKIAKSAGMVRGAYHFARPDTGNSPEDEADYFCNIVGELSPGDLVALDWETAIPDHFPIVDWCKRFLDRVQARTGVKGLNYLNQSEVDSYDWGPVIAADYSLWLADYEDPTNATPWPVVAFRQYTSSGAVPGISGAVDRDVFYGDEAALAKYGKQGGSPVASNIVRIGQSADVSVKLGEATEVQAEFLWPSGKQRMIKQQVVSYAPGRFIVQLYPPLDPDDNPVIDYSAESAIFVISIV